MAATRYSATGSSGAGPKGASCRRICITVLTLVAFWLQSYLSLTHVHGLGARNGTVAASSVTVAGTPKPQPYNQKDTCPLCRFLCGVATLVPPASVAAPVPAAVYTVVLQARVFFVAGGIFRHDQWVRGPPR